MEFMSLKHRTLTSQRSVQNANQQVQIRVFYLGKNKYMHIAQQNLT